MQQYFIKLVCGMAPWLFKFASWKVLYNAERNAKKLCIPIKEYILDTMNFADDQVTCAQDEHNANCILRKSNEEYFK